MNAVSSNRLSTVVRIEAPARLHLGFLDMSGALGRRFGSLGLTIDAYRTRITARAERTVSAQGPDAERAADYARALLDALGIQHGVRLDIDSAIPGHLGLGSGTQLALTVGRAIAELYDTEVSTSEIAARLGRGRRSGIGVGAFDQGGFLLDSGVAGTDVVPPVTSRLAFPEDWRVLLVLDARGEGLHGRQETEAFRNLPPFPSELAAHLCHLAIMRILPGVQEGNLQSVSEGIAEVQRCVGDHFAPAQGGRFTSRAVADALAWAESVGFPGVGQSSWGPTGFVLLPDQASAEALQLRARERYGDLSPLRFVITRACNHGSLIHQTSTSDVVKEAY